MSEKRWTPKIVKVESIPSLVETIKNTIDTKVSEYDPHLTVSITTLNSDGETRIRTRFLLKDESGFITKKQPSSSSLSYVVNEIAFAINERSFDKEKFEITTKTGTDSDDTLFTDFIIREL